jgi:hypothetical protein
MGLLEALAILLIIGWIIGLVLKVAWPIINFLLVIAVIALLVGLIL